MSDTRDKAWEAHVEKTGKSYANLTPAEVYRLLAFQESFVAGWDAAVAARPLPDRETIARTLALVDDYDGCFVRIDEWEALPEWERLAQPQEEPLTDREDAEFWLRRADAVLSLFTTDTTKEKK